jgi:hypothetical protein
MRPLILRPFILFGKMFDDPPVCSTLHPYMLIIKISLAKPAVLALAGILSAALTLSTTAAQPEFLELDWPALIPEDWEEPMILPAPQGDGHYPVDPKALVQELDGQQISLSGYMVPVHFERNVVSEFLFVPYLGHHLKSHAHYNANQMVYVNLSEPIAVLDPFSAWFVQGLLRVASVTTEDGRTGYTLEHARAETYIADKHDGSTERHSN